MASVTLNSLILCNGKDLSSYFKGVDVDGQVDLLDNTNLGQTSNARTYQPGLKENTIKGETFFTYDGTTDANSIDRIFSEAFSAEKVFLVAPEGYSAVGDHCYIANTKQAQYSIKETVGELIMLDFEAKASSGSTYSGGFAQGLIFMHATQTGTANGTTVDNAATSAGYLAQCHCTEYTSGGLDAITVKIQHSTNGSAWSDLVTFTDFTADGVQRATATTTVNRYRRAIVSAFAATSAKISVAFASPYSV